MKNKPVFRHRWIFPFSRQFPAAASLVLYGCFGGLVATIVFCPAASAQQPAAATNLTGAALPDVSPLLSLPQSGVVQLTRVGSNSSTAAGDAPAPPALKLGFDSPDLFSPTRLSLKPELATVILAYDLVCVGARVIVAPLDGGTINGTPGGQTLTVGLDGKVAFSFLAPASPGRYHVVTRLVTPRGSRERALPFDVIDPTAPQPLPVEPADD